MNLGLAAQSFGPADLWELRRMPRDSAWDLRKRSYWRDPVHPSRQKGSSAGTVKMRSMRLQHRGLGSRVEAAREPDRLGVLAVQLEQGDFGSCASGREPC